MTSQRAIHHITAWLAQLAELTRAGAEPVTKAKLASYATMLAELFPVGAFTAASLRHAVAGHEYFPAYDPLRERIGECWRAQQERLAIANEDAGDWNGRAGREAPSAFHPDLSVREAYQREQPAWWKGQ